jgi:hypothetical protein
MKHHIGRKVRITLITEPPTSAPLVAVHDGGIEDVYFQIRPYAGRVGYFSFRNQYGTINKLERDRWAVEVIE